MQQETLEKYDQILTGIESQLRVFVQEHDLGGQLADEVFPWDESERKLRLHKGGLDGYNFERYNGYVPGPNPSRCIRWQGHDGLSYLMQIFYANDPQTDFILVSMVGKIPFGPEAGRFQDVVTLRLPLDPESFTQLLENKYQLLIQEAVKIQPYTPGV